MDPNRDESTREEKIRGKRKPAWGRLRERGRVVNTRAGKAARKNVEASLPDGKLHSSEWKCHGMERKL